MSTEAVAPPTKITVKTVVTGPFAAGKTALISHLSETPVVKTEAEVCEDTRITKESTTVSMDFGSLTVDSGGLTVELMLFGTPGQGRFEFMWDVLANGMVGFVLLVDVSDPHTWDDAARILEHFSDSTSAPFVVGANRAGEAAEGRLEELRAHLQLDADVAVVPCEVVERESAKTLVVALLEAVLADVEANGSAASMSSPLAQPSRSGA